MSGKIIQFPKPGLEDGAWTPQEQRDDLFDLHSRLIEAFTAERYERPDPDEIPVTLSIDDVMQLCQLIEDELGLEYFSEEELDQ